MLEDKKYGFEEVDKISINKESGITYLLYIIIYSVSYFYVTTSLFDWSNHFISLSLTMLYPTLLLLTVWGISSLAKSDSKKSETKAKERKYAELMNEKCELEQKYMNMLNQNPNTLEDYIKTFLLAYGSDEHEYYKHSYNFKRILYLNKKISSEQLRDVSEPDKVVAQVKEKITLENKFKEILNKNPVTLEDYVKLFSSTYGESYRDNLADFKRLLYLRGITIKSENEIEFILKAIEEKKQLSLLENKFKEILNKNPVTLEDYVQLFSSIYGESYSDNLADFKRLLYLRGITIKSKNEIELLLTAIEEKKQLSLLENKFKLLLNDDSVTLKDYVGLFLFTYKNEYPVNLHLFKKMLLIQKNITSIKVEEELELYFYNIVSKKSSFKSIYGFEPIYDFKLIHDFSKKYGYSYNDDDLANLNKLLLTKGIKIHDKALLKGIISEANMEFFYSIFTEKMKTETLLDETGYIQKAMMLFGENYNNYLILHTLHRYFAEHNLTSLDYNNFEDYIKTRIFELNLLSDKKQLSVCDIEGMNGYEFEAFVGQLYEKMGYSVEQTPLSNDQGADLIISKYGERTAVQVKNYTSNVGNGAIQEVVAAKKYYGCSSCSVVTNSYFTKSAVELADANGVKLVDRDELNYLINNKGIEIDPKSDSAWCVKGCELSSLRRYEEAQILSRNYHIQNGCELSSLGRYEEAIQVFDKAIEVDPKSELPLSSKGLVLSILGRYEEAIQAFDKAVEIDSKSEIPWSNKGWALSSLGRYEEAIQAFDKAIEIDSKYGSAWGGKSLALSSLGRDEEANEAFDRAKELGYTES